jgi:hypothetical protein
MWLLSYVEFGNPVLVCALSRGRTPGLIRSPADPSGPASLGDRFARAAIDLALAGVKPEFAVGQPPTGRRDSWYQAPGT